MQAQAPKFTTVDEYMKSLPAEKRSALEAIRKTAKKAAPQATEVISYGMPALKGKRVLVYYAAMKDHYGFYPTADGVAAFEHELANYKFSKGAIQFPANQPIDHDLIARIVAYRAKRDAEKAAKG